MDTNEKTKNPDIYNELIKKGLIVALKDMEIGDYILLSEDPKKTIIIERKTINDLVSSIVDSRIWKQSKKLKEYSVKTGLTPLIILEGDLSRVLQYRKINETALLRVIDTMTIDYDIKVLPTPSKKATINWLASKAKTLGKTGKKTRIPLPHKKKPSTIDERIIIAMATLVGEETALKLLRKYGNIRTIANLSLNELKNIEGIGDKKAKEIYTLFNKNLQI